MVWVLGELDHADGALVGEQHEKWPQTCFMRLRKSQMSGFCSVVSFGMCENSHARRWAADTVSLVSGPRQPSGKQMPANLRGWLKPWQSNLELWHKFPLQCRMTISPRTLMPALA